MHVLCSYRSAIDPCLSGFQKSHHTLCNNTELKGPLVIIIIITRIKTFSKKWVDM